MQEVNKLDAIKITSCDAVFRIILDGKEMANNNINFYTKPLMKNDYFWLLQFLSIGIFNYKIITVYMIFSLAVQLVVYVVEIRMFIIQPSYFLKYAPFLFSRAYGMTAIAAILWKHNQMKNMWEGFDLLSVENMPPHFQSKTKKTVRTSHFIEAIIICLGAFIGMLFVIPNSSDFEYNLIMLLVKEWYPDFSPLFVLFIKLAEGPIFYCMMVHPLFSDYASLHVRIQGYMMMEDIKKITEDFEKEDGGIVEDLVYDEGFQNEIQRRLGCIIVRHAQIIMFVRRLTNDVVKPLFIVLVISGFVLGLCSALMVYEVHLKVYRNTVRSKMLVIVFVIMALGIFVLMMHAGEAAKNASEEIFVHFYNMKWYAFNKSNKMTTIVMLQNSMNPLRVYFSTELAVDYDLGVRIFRGLYSALSLVVVTMNLEH